MHDHRYRILVTTSKGYISQCKACGSFEIGFGNFALVMSRSEFYTFSELIQRIAQQKIGNTFTNAGHEYVLRYTGTSIFLTFSKSDIYEFQELIRVAEIEDQIQQLLRENIEP